jgi:hypothetical protein
VADEPHSADVEPVTGDGHGETGGNTAAGGSRGGTGRARASARPQARRRRSAAVSAAGASRATAGRAQQSEAAAERPGGDRTGRSRTSGAPPTEKPVATTRQLSEYVISVDEATGLVVKIEKLDGETSNRDELTQQEYAAAYSYACYTAPYYATAAAALYDPLQSPAAQAYLKNIADYVKAMSPSS